MVNLSLLFTPIGFLPDLLFYPENRNDIFFRNTKLSFNGLISQRTDLFIITAVEALHPANFIKFVGAKETVRGMIWMG
jgi:hypothetical protein